MYTDTVTTQDEALSHLFFHCCLKDGSFEDSEMDTISAKLVAVGLHKNLNFKDEVKKYRSYNQHITDEHTYLQYLLKLINPTNELALYSWCTELCLSDATLSPSEGHLLENLAAELQITAEDSSLIQKLMVQRKVVETEKIF